MRSTKSKPEPINPLFSDRSLRVVATIKTNMEDHELQTLLDSIIQVFQSIRSQVATVIEKGNSSKISVTIDEGNGVFRLREEATQILTGLMAFLGKMPFFKTGQPVKTSALYLTREGFRYKEGEKEEKGEYKDKHRPLKKHLKFFKDRLKTALEQSGKSQKKS